MAEAASVVITMLLALGMRGLEILVENIVDNVTLATSTTSSTELPSLFQGIFGQLLEGDRPVLSEPLTATNISYQGRNEDLELEAATTDVATTTHNWRELFVNFKVTEITTQETTTATTSTRRYAPTTGLLPEA